MENDFTKKLEDVYKFEVEGSFDLNIWIFEALDLIRCDSCNRVRIYIFFEFYECGQWFFK